MSEICKCPECGFVGAHEEFKHPEPMCEFKGCDKPAEFEGWWRVRDFAGLRTGLVRKHLVCAEHSSYLIGGDKEGEYERG